MTNEKRIEIEQRIVMHYVRALLAAGFAITVNDGEDTVLERSTDWREVRKVLFSTDEDYLYVRRVRADGTVFRGILHFIYGNKPGEVLNDYSSSPELETVIAPTNAYAEQWA